MLLREILGLSLPVLLGMISYTTINVADTYMVSQLGEEAIAATGIGGLAYFTILSFLMGGSVGIQILTSRRFGEKKEIELGRIGINILYLGVLIAIFITFAGLYFSDNFISLITDEPKISQSATDYLRFRFIGTLFFVLQYFVRGYLDGLGDTYVGMLAAFFTMIANIFLNWVLIYGNLGSEALGIRGAAIASSLAGGIGFLVTTGFLFRTEILTYFRSAGWGLDIEILKNTFSIGLPSAIDASLTNLSFLGFNKIAASIGVSSVAGSQVIFSVLSISFMPGMAFGVAATTLLGKGMGEGKFRYAELGTYHSARYAAFVMGIMGILFIIFGKWIIFQFGGSETLVTEAYPGLVAVALVQVGDAYHMVLGAALRSAGYVLWVPLVYFLVSYCIMLPTAYFLGIGMGLGTTGLWSSISLWLIFLFGIFYWKFRQGTWKSKRI